MKVEPYLFFNGQCEEAIAFYQQALGAEVTMQMPLGKTFYSPCFGMVTDRFGVGWMVIVAQ